MENGQEYTFVTGRGMEFMVWFENNLPNMIYTYKDTGVLGLSTAQWKPYKNPSFKHCPENLIYRSWEYLRKEAYCSEIKL